MSNFAKTSGYINKHDYACLKKSYAFKNMYRTNIYIMTVKSCWQALNMEEHERENDKGYKGLLGPATNNSTRKLTSLCLQQNEISCRPTVIVTKLEGVV